MSFRACAMRLLSSVICHLSLEIDAAEAEAILPPARAEAVSAEAEAEAHRRRPPTAVEYLLEVSCDTADI